MKKSQIILLVVIFSFLLAVISIPELIKYFSPNENLEIKKIKGEGIEYSLTQGDFLIGKDAPEGYYDVSSDGDNYFNGIQLSDGDNFLGVQLYDKNIAQVTGKGSIKIREAAFSPVDKDGDVYKIRHSGFYKIGEQIKSGKYKITYETKNNELLKEQPWFQIRTADLQKNIAAYYFTETNQFEVDLNENTWLEIYQSGLSTNANVTLILIPLN